MKKWMKVAAFTVAALLLGYGLTLVKWGEKAEFEVVEEFEREVLIPLPTIGPFDMSITKTVAYLLIALVVVVVLALVISRNLRHHPSRVQLGLETLYDLTRSGIVGSVMHKGQDAWFPYIGGVFFFVLISNLIGLVPLPFGEHHQPAYYAATANINVTIALALLTFVFTHFAGIKEKGLVRYLAGWAPKGAPWWLLPALWLLHAISEIFRLISLSVRLFANMLAGHIILGVFFAIALLFQSYLIALALQGASVVIYMFEIFVAFIQAFIFAILSAVYIGGAMEDH